MTAAKVTSSNNSHDSDLCATPFLNSLTYDGATPRFAGSNCSWDVAACCQSLLPTFHYLSGKLAFQGLHVAIIVLDSSPELVSAWPIDRHTQQFLNKLVARADFKYSLTPTWVAAFNELCNPLDSEEAIELYRENTYLVHRSLSQKDIIYSGNGLTVLAVDYIYKFKEQLVSLAKEDTFPWFRDDYKESCVTLLRHINETYQDIPLSRTYLRRAYPELSIREDILEEVCETYRGKYEITIETTSPPPDQTAASLHHKQKYTTLAEHTQESPRKLPVVTTRVRNSNNLAIATARNKSENIQTTNLGSPFEYNAFLDQTRTSTIERPRSPKGEMFESPRYAPTTPSKTIKDQDFYDPMNSQVGTSSFSDSDDSSDLTRVDTRVETASMLSSRSKRFFASWLSISRSNSLSSFLKDKMSVRGTVGNSVHNTQRGVQPSDRWEHGNPSYRHQLEMNQKASNGAKTNLLKPGRSNSLKNRNIKSGNTW